MKYVITSKDGKVIEADKEAVDNALLRVQKLHQAPQEDAEWMTMPDVSPTDLHLADIVRKSARLEQVNDDGTTDLKWSNQ